MNFYLADGNSPTSQTDQWWMGFPVLPGGSWSTPYDCSRSTSHAQLQSMDLSPGETCSFDMMEGLVCDTSTSPKVLGMTCHEAPAPLSSSQGTMYLTHKQMLFDESARPPESMRTSITPDFSSDSSPAHPAVRQYSSVQRLCPSTSSDKSEDAPSICIQRKEAHNQVERRYRANLNAGFKQLEDITKQEAGTIGTDVKSAKGLRPGRKALILQNAYDRIISLQFELQALQNKIETL
ncbi:uncharacterized protein BDW43DRAFT_305850 [Aspergillus alliaceus]|nr:uncharacterized protein BDW43DRAFT_305850 [Aspergillus alliaceus]KAB8238961.1 hypothetical protein BDW43DRAFT_305850 [Aspergillus alliaceus]